MSVTIVNISISMSASKISSMSMGMSAGMSTIMSVKMSPSMSKSACMNISMSPRASWITCMSKSMNQYEYEYVYEYKYECWYDYKYESEYKCQFENELVLLGVGVLMRVLNYIFMAYAQQVLDANDTRPRSPAQLLPDFMASAAAACVAAFCEGCFYITASLCALRDRPLIHHCPTPSNELLMYRQWTDDSPLPRGAYKLPLPLLPFSLSLSLPILSLALSLVFLFCLRALLLQLLGSRLYFWVRFAFSSWS